MEKKLKDYVISMRREFHMYPEVSLGEVRTSTRVFEELKEMGLDPIRYPSNSVVVDIKGTSSGKTILLRGDMDALTIQEETGLEYSSKNNGVMHACGHDGHTSMMLGAARYLAENNTFAGTVRCVFQSAEEVGKGADLIIKEGNVLKGVDRVFAIHLWTDIECGGVYVEEGGQTAAVGIFKIEVEGKGGHGSMPQQCIDAVVVGSNIVTSLQNIISRGINPMDVGVITVGEFHAGDRFNIITGKATLSGTTRVYNPELLSIIPEKMTKVINGVCDMFEAKATFEHEWAIKSPSINDSATVNDIKNIISNNPNKYQTANLSPLPIGEDFASFLGAVPGALALVGARNEAKGIVFPHHHPKFQIDEDALEVGTNLYIDVALDFLK